MTKSSSENPLLAPWPRLQGHGQGGVLRLSPLSGQWICAVTTPGPCLGPPSPTLLGTPGGGGKGV